MKVFPILFKYGKKGQKMQQQNNPHASVQNSKS